MRILIAEDEKSLNALLKKQLEAQSYSVDRLPGRAGGHRLYRLHGL